MRMRHPDGQVFEFDAGALCQEFVFTGGEGFRARFETFTAPVDVAEWTARSRLGIDGVAVSDEEFATLWRLREALWSLTQAAVAGEALDPPSVRLVNDLAAGAPPAPQLVDGAVGWRRPVDGTQVAAAVARDAAVTLAEPTVRRLRRCAGDNCLLTYVDASRQGNRRWCAMERCGNRHKIREFRQRQGRPT
ncbi:MAG TPA: ABATE domain-containing protein [Micromonosporaceae bacterium]|nr:ABATE domain-containing protein [Micromonosporaceae bacterium]